MPIRKWRCPVCTLSRKEPCILNSAPYRPDTDHETNQGNDHFKGKRHARAMKHVGESLLSESAIVEFFSYPIPLNEDPKPFKPDLRRSPLQVLKDYTEYCGGDPELTAPHFIYVPPGEERKTIKCVTRGIRSPIYATAWEGRGVVWTRLLCCWDDPSEPEDGKKKCTPGIPPQLGPRL